MVSSRVIICSESSVHVMSGIVITSVLMYFKRPPVAIRAYKNHYRRGNHAFLLDRPHYFGQFSACYKCTNGTVHSTPCKENKHESIKTKIPI